jgi:hypothetical protein
MTIQIWKSYSCNNSSSYRLVAKFADPARAHEVATELRELFTVHAEEVDQREDYDDAPSDAQRALGTKYGFDWGEVLAWGDDGLAGDEPDVFVHEAVLIVQHTYCGGLDLAGFALARGAVTAAQEDRSTVPVSLLFRPTADPRLDLDLSTMFHDFEARKSERHELKPPWAEHESYGQAAWFRDAGATGIHMQIDPRDLAALTAWMSERGVENLSMRIEEREDLMRFEAIAKARCTACRGRLEYLDPRIHDIESPQLVCKPCGGLYELATFLPKP